LRRLPGYSCVALVWCFGRGWEVDKSGMRMQSQKDVFLWSLLVGCVWDFIAVEEKKNRKRGQVLAAIL
jgi:hypothetical protein